MPADGADQKAQRIKDINSDRRCLVLLTRRRTLAMPIYICSAQQVVLFKHLIIQMPILLD
jgi:hypothetical protein